jgi:lantibiotic modifying enzyme
VGVTARSPQPLQSRTAGAIADALVETAIVDGDRCTWLSASVELREEQRCVVHRTGVSTVYEGDAGIAWALAQAALVLERGDLAEAARTGALGAVQRADPSSGGGLYDGAAGVAAAALQVGTAVGDAALASQALELLDAALATAPAGDDVVSGSAGLILAALAAAAASDDPVWLEAATRLGRLLVERAQPRPWGWCWPAADGAEPGLCGLAHGSSGIAWALAELAARRGSAEFDAAIREALRYERSWFDRERSNWPDLRVDGRVAAGSRAFPAWWCHGAAGAGLVRLRLRELGFDDPVLAAEAGAAFRATFAEAAAPLRAGNASDFGLTLCHGAGGAVELFLEAHAVLGEEEHLTTARWLLDRSIGVLGPQVEWWADGLGATGASPGLMTGLAGSLVVVLRAAAPERVPGPGLFPL